MDLPVDWTEANALVATFLIAHGAALPAEVQGRLVAAASLPPVDRLVAHAEILYAVADDAGAPAQTLVAQVASFVVGNFQHLSTGEEPARGLRMIKAMRRRLGELTEGEAPSADDPTPSPGYLPA